MFECKKCGKKYSINDGEGNHTFCNDCLNKKTKVLQKEAETNPTYEVLKEISSNVKLISTLMMIFAAISAISLIFLFTQVF